MSTGQIGLRCEGCGEQVAEADVTPDGSHGRVVTETIYEDVIGHERKCYENSACSCSGVLEGVRAVGERPIGEEECGPVTEERGCAKCGYTGAAFEYPSGGLGGVCPNCAPVQHESDQR